MVRHYRIIAAVFIGFFITVFFSWRYSVNSAPLLANYYLPWKIPASDVVNLAKWDLLILDMETQATSRAQIEQIRKINPDIIILAYVTSQEIADNHQYSKSFLRKELGAGVAPQWFLARPNGQKIVFWPGTTMLNSSNLCPAVGGVKWNDHLARFAVDRVLSSGLWDGIFYDNAWGGVEWFTGSDLDYNRDGAADINLDEQWRAGMRYLFNETRRLALNKTGKDILIIGNGVAEDYGDELNGMMIENFQNYNWDYAVKIYRFQQNGAKLPRAVIINNNNNNSGNQANYQNVRYGLASALVAGEGYYSFDDGDKGHELTWWYDEYDVNLGAAVSESPSFVSPLSGGKNRVYRRDYANGLALVNPTEGERAVDLGGEYEKIIGTQDKAVNSGGIVSKVNLPARDGLILRKTFQGVSNVFFLNGGFVRFFTSEGARARNGFFVFADGFSGGAEIFNGDLDGASGVEKIVAENGRLRIFDSVGRIWHDSESLFSETSKRLNLAVGNLERDKGKRLVAAGDSGGAVLLATYYGAPFSELKYPLGKKYQYGFSVAIGDVDGGDGDVILGTGRGGAGEVIIMDKYLARIKRRFYPYGWGFKTGVAVGAGDVGGDGRAEILTVGKVGDKIIVKIFNAAGQKLKEFSAGTALGATRFNVAAADVDGDGRVEVVVGSE